MAKRVMEQTCPGCRQSFETEVDVPDEQPTVSPTMIAEINRQVTKYQEDAARSAAAAALSTSELSHVKDELATANKYIEAVKAGDAHGDPAATLSHFASCPECQPALNEFLGRHDNRMIGNLTTDQVKELARKHKFWPPPSIEIPDRLLKGR